jgi:hypothetical protein
MGGKTTGDLDQYRKVIREIHRHGIGVVGLFVFGFDHDRPKVFEELGLNFEMTGHVE